MATESEGSQLSVRLPSDLQDWLDDLAEERGVDRDRLLERLLTASQHALTDESTEDDLGDRVANLEDDLDSKINDVRSRVLQVKKEADAKANSDHDHDEFERFNSLDDRVTQLAATISDIEADIEALEATIDGHEDEMETISLRLQRVAGAVVRLQRATDTADDSREQLDELRSIAAQRGFQTANCGACDNSVNISLLSDPTCPHCDVTFQDITGRSGFFSTPTLVGEGADEQ